MPSLWRRPLPWIQHVSAELQSDIITYGCMWLTLLSGGLFVLSHPDHWEKGKAFKYLLFCWLTSILFVSMFTSFYKEKKVLQRALDVMLLFWGSLAIYWSGFYWRTLCEIKLEITPLPLLRTEWLGCDDSVYSDLWCHKTSYNLKVIIKVSRLTCTSVVLEEIHIWSFV